MFFFKHRWPWSKEVTREKPCFFFRSELQDVMTKLISRNTFSSPCYVQSLTVPCLSIPIRKDVGIWRALRKLCSISSLIRSTQADETKVNFAFMRWAHETWLFLCQVGKCLFIHNAILLHIAMLSFETENKYTSIPNLNKLNGLYSRGIWRGDHNLNVEGCYDFAIPLFGPFVTAYDMRSLDCDIACTI